MWKVAHNLQTFLSCCRKIWIMIFLNQILSYGISFALWTIICSNLTAYTAKFLLLICQVFNFLSTIISQVLGHLNNFLPICGCSRWNFYLFMAHLKDFGSLLSSFGEEDSGFRSQFHIFVGSAGRKSFAE